LSFLALALLACSTELPAESSESQFETTQQAIVGGKKESGWEGVGALTRNATAYGYYGSFCSGTLVAPQWVLTAGHCLYGQPGEPLFPENVKFYVGPNSNPPWYGFEPDEGKLYQADAFFIHPEYNAQYTSNDIALMHLAAPVADVPFYPMSTKTIDNSFMYEQILYVGYGVSSGISNQGGGVKRSGYMKFWAYEKTYYVSGYEKSGVCFGDSGGPGFLEIDGEMKVIGVNSSVWSQNQDPCTGGAIQTRVDTYAEWISETMVSEDVDCRVNAGLCFCPQGCTVDGYCDNSFCETLSCGEVRECFDECDDNAGCQADCFVRASADAQQELLDYYWCRMQKCYNSSNREACGETKCFEYKDACETNPEGTASCRQVFDCVDSCDWSDEHCFTDCLYWGTNTAQSTYIDLWQCFEDECSALPDYGFQQSCGWDFCGIETEVCIEPADCSILGGDCQEDSACWFSPTGKMDCFASDALGEGDSCPLLALSTRPCDDGLQCVAVGANTECRQVCAAASECAMGEVCLDAEIPGLPAYGYCACKDEDGDGFCSLSDCDDSDPKVNPARGEKCWDEVDNNCNGEIDEACTVDGDDPGVSGTIEMTNETSGCSALPTGAPDAWLLLLALAALLACARRLST